MPILPSRFPVKLLPRVDFRPEEFRKLVRTHGLELTWQQSSECPCSRQSVGLGLVLDADLGSNTGTTRQARVDCPSCEGKGYLFHSSQGIRGVITSAATHPDRFKVYGEMASGMVSLSVLPEHRLNLGDRVTLGDSVQLYRETHTYSGEDPSSTRYPIVERTLDLTAPVTTGVMHAYQADADGTAPLGGDLVEGVDFNVVGGALAWINPPVVGARWSISYYSNPVYLVTDLPHPYRDTIVQTKAPSPSFASLPLNAMCTLEYLVTGSAS
jgi:hypothetical protein